MKTARTLGRLAPALLALLAPAPALAQSKTWTLNTDFDTGSLTSVEHPAATPNELLLGGTPVSKTTLVWATNYRYGYVVRLDSTTGKQTSRFDSSLASINGLPTGTPPPNEYCDFATTGNCPGRVAVDTNGDVWIINRAFGKQGSLSKFSGSIDHCIDRNGNGVIDTSNDANGDGVISVTDPKEYFGQNDECILTTIPIGPSNVYPRGVAIDKKGRVWASTWVDGKVYRFNANEPVSQEAAVTVGGNPYSLATGGDYLFVSRSSGVTNRIHIDTLAVESVSCPGTYGIVADPGGDVAWLGGYFTGDGVYKADFKNKTCTYISTGGGAVTAMTLDLQGNVWAANYNSNVLHKLNPAGVIVGTYPAGGTNPHGLSVDFQGFLWVILHGPPSVAKVNTATGAILNTYSIGGPGVPDADPYLYSDFTGVQVNRQAPFTRLGNWSATHDGGQPALPWTKVSWNTEASGATPTETSLEVLVRAADVAAALAQAPYVKATNGAALSGVKGRFLQVQVNFAGPGYVTPVLSDLTVEGACGATGSDACCLTDADCTDSDLCTTDTCPAPGAACKHAPKAQCCHTDADCDDKNLCSKDSCPADGAQCVHDVTPGCCFSNKDCADADPCTQDVCSGPGGTCSHPLIQGCCNGDADCKAASVCTTSTCSGPGGVCKTTSVPDCCTKDADCVDADPCSTDACDKATGKCANKAIAGCCTQDGQCNDGLACTQDKCSGPGGVCVATQIAGCCSTDADCDDGNPCTTGTCPAPGGSCQFTTVASCCATDADCADGNLCTDDTCPTPGGACQNTAKPSCCLTNADCNDGDLCTKDRCDFPGGSCVASPIPGCCKSDADCTDATCVDNVCVPTGAGGNAGASGASGASGSSGTAGAAGEAGSAGASGASGAAGEAGAAGSSGQGGAGAGGAGASGSAGNAGSSGAAGQGGAGASGASGSAGQGGAGAAGSAGSGQSGTSPGGSAGSSQAGSAGAAGKAAEAPATDPYAGLDLEGGCGCVVAGQQPERQQPWALAALAALGLGLRRRRR